MTKVGKAAGVCVGRGSPQQGLYPGNDAGSFSVSGEWPEPQVCSVESTKHREGKVM